MLLRAREAPPPPLLPPLDGARPLRLVARLLIETQEQLGQARGLIRAVTLSALDQSRWQPKARGDGQGVALPGTVVDDAKRGRQRRDVELDRGVASPGMVLANAFSGSRWVVAMTRHPLGQLLEDRLGQGGPLVGVRACAQLVQDDQRARIGVGRISRTCLTKAEKVERFSATL